MCPSGKNLKILDVLDFLNINFLFSVCLCMYVYMYACVYIYTHTHICKCITEVAKCIQVKAIITNV